MIAEHEIFTKLNLATWNEVIRPASTSPFFQYNLKEKERTNFDFILAFALLINVNIKTNLFFTKKHQKPFWLIWYLKIPAAAFFMAWNSANKAWSAIKDEAIDF